MTGSVAIAGGIPLYTSPNPALSDSANAVDSPAALLHSTASPSQIIPSCFFASQSASGGLDLIRNKVSEDQVKNFTTTIYIQILPRFKQRCAQSDQVKRPVVRIAINASSFAFSLHGYCMHKLSMPKTQAICSST